MSIQITSLTYRKTAGKTEAIPEENIPTCQNCQKLLTEDASPELAEAPLCRSVCISKTSEDILSDKSSAYIQFPDSGDGAEKNS